MRSHTESSRAGHLPLVGGLACLNFTNTASGRGSPASLDHLLGADEVASWAEHAAVLTVHQGGRLRSRLTEDPGAAARFLARVIRFRELLHTTASAITHRLELDPSDLAAILGVHRTSLASARLEWTGANLSIAWPPDSDPVAAFFGILSQSFLDLVARADLPRLKQCPGPGCGWLFLDQTKNGSRLWCEMSVCGNRTKQRRFQHTRNGADVSRGEGGD